MKEARDNVAKVEFGGEEWELESSLGAAKVYKDQFAGGVDDPYTGSFFHDTIALYNEVTDAEDAYDVPDALFRIAWAMRRAAGDTDLTYEAFAEELEHMGVSFRDIQNLFAAIVVELGNRVTFRDPSGRDDSEQPVDGEE